MSNEAVLTVDTPQDNKPTLSERMHGAVRQLVMDGCTETLGKLVDDLIDLYSRTPTDWASAIPAEQIVQMVKRDLRVWGP